MMSVTGLVKPVMLAALVAITGGILANSAMAQKTETTILAGGCFWCIESDFDNVTGVLDTISGYTGGTLENPTYKSVTAGGSGHLEALEITFDPDVISFSEILDVFWRSIDPTDAGGQFCDRGYSYTTAIFPTSEEQQKTSELSKQLIEDSGFLKDPVVTPILPATTFYPAENYHQDFATKNPVRYKFYRFSCGRDAKVKALWGDQAHRGINDH